MNCRRREGEQCHGRVKAGWRFLKHRELSGQDINACSSVFSVLKPAFGFKRDDDVCFAMVHFDEVQVCCTTPHVQGHVYGTLHLLPTQICGVFCNPVGISTSVKHAET